MNDLFGARFSCTNTILRHPPERRAASTRVTFVAVACLSRKYCHRVVTCARASMTPADSIFRNSCRNFHVGAPTTTRRVGPRRGLSRRKNSASAKPAAVRIRNLSLSLSPSLSPSICRSYAGTLPDALPANARIVIHTIEKAVTQRVSTGTLPYPHLGTPALSVAVPARLLLLQRLYPLYPAMEKGIKKKGA